MIDAMCSECRYFGCRIFHPNPGWTCGKDNEREHDPTNQACTQFRRRREALMLVAQDIPVAVHPTGRVKQDADGRIVDVEVAPKAAHWDGFVAWIPPHKLIWANTPSDIVSRLPDVPVSHEELNQVCRFEAAVADVSVALICSSEKMGLTQARAAAEGIVEAVNSLSFPIYPAELVTPMKNAGRIGDLISGISAHSIISDLAKSGALSRWGVAGFVESNEEMS